MNQYPNLPKKNLVNTNLNSDINMNQPDLYSNQSTTPSMGQVNSKDIGLLPYAGRLGGEMVRKMIKEQEDILAKQYDNDHLE